MLVLLDERQNRLEDPAGVAGDGERGGDVLVDLTVVDVDLYDLCRAGKLGHLGRNAVGETGAECNQQIRLVRSSAGGNPAVHADHAEIQRILLIQRADAHHRMACRNFRLVHQLFQRLARARADDAAAEIDRRTLALVDHVRQLLNIIHVDLRKRTRLDCRLRLVLAFRRGDILRDIDQNRSRTAAHRDLKREADGVGQILDMADDEVVLGNRHGDAGDVDLLEAVASDRRGADVAGNRNHRDRIHICGGNAGDEVGRTRTAGCQHDADLAGCACESVGGMRRTLLMCRHDMGDAIGILIQLIVNIEDSAARVTENRIGSLLQQCLNENLRAIEFHCNHS